MRVCLLFLCQFLASGVSFALDASSEITLRLDGFRTMRGAEIERLVAGRTVTLTYGRENREVVYFYSFSGARSSLSDGYRIDKQWYVDGDRLCEEYLGPNDFVCAAVYEKDGTVQLCPEGENLCWYVLHRVQDGDVNGILEKAPRL